MKNSDTIELLKECGAGVKMAVASFDNVLDEDLLKNVHKQRIWETAP